MKFPPVIVKQQVIPFSEWLPLANIKSSRDDIRARTFYNAQIRAHMRESGPKVAGQPIKYLNSKLTFDKSSLYEIAPEVQNVQIFQDELARYQFGWQAAPEDPSKIDPFFRAHDKGGLFIGHVYLDKYMRDGPSIPELVQLRYTLEKWLDFCEIYYRSLDELIQGKVRKNAKNQVDFARNLLSVFQKRFKQMTPSIHWTQMLEMSVVNLKQRKLHESKMRFGRSDYSKFCKSMQINMKAVPKWGPFSIFIEYTIKMDPDVSFEDFWSRWCNLGSPFGLLLSQESQIKLYGTDDAWERITKTGRYEAFKPKEERLVAYRKPTGNDAW